MVRRYFDKIRINRSPINLLNKSLFNGSLNRVSNSSFKDREMETSYNYEVKLLKVFSRNYTESGSFLDNDSTQNGRFWQLPNEDIKGNNHDCVKDNSRENYAFLQRRKEINRKLKDLNHIPRFEFKDNTKWDEATRGLIRNNFEQNGFPHIICNLSSLVTLMCSNEITLQKPIVIRARRFDLGNGATAIHLTEGYQSDFKTVNQLNTYAYQLEIPDGVELEGDQTNANKILECLYGAQLTGSGNHEPIRIAFLAETDGLLRNRTDDLKETIYSKSDVIEIKSVGKENLISRTYNPYYFEETLLKRYYCQCRIRGMTSNLICNFVADNTLKERWLYDVDQIPKVVLRCSQTSGKKWNRAFPKSLLTGNENENSTAGSPKIWTEEDCFNNLQSFLKATLDSFKSAEAEDEQYFIRDELTIKNEHILDKIDLDAYEEQDLVKRQLLLVFKREDYVQKLKGFKLDKMSAMKIFKSVGIPFTNYEGNIHTIQHNTIRVECNSIPETGTASYRSTQEIVLLITFDDSAGANYFRQRFYQNKEKDVRKMYAGVFLISQLPARVKNLARPLLNQ